MTAREGRVNVVAMMPPRLAEDLGRVARRQGISRSELLRRLSRNAVRAATDERSTDE